MRSGPEARQIIRAHGGFAYGVVDGDVHIVGRGDLRYAMEPWHRPAPCLRRTAKAVPPTLQTWRDDVCTLAMRWLHGGSAETRARLRDALAVGTLHESWAVHTVTRLIGAEPDRARSVGDHVLGTPTDRLFLIDDAHNWDLTRLTWLLSNAVFLRAGVRTRVLLTADNRDNWPRLRSSLSGLQPALSAEAIVETA